MQDLVLSFPPFRLDVADERLWKNGTEIKLRRKPFAILKYLAMHPRRLVTQEALIEAVWGKVQPTSKTKTDLVSKYKLVLASTMMAVLAGPVIPNPNWPPVTPAFWACGFHKTVGTPPNIAPQPVVPGR